MSDLEVFNKKSQIKSILPTENRIWSGKVEGFLDSLGEEEVFDLVVTSPPYNLGKEYETRQDLTDYINWQESIIDRIVPRVKSTGSICWQVGNYVGNGQIMPLDIELAPIFKKHNLQLRNRIIWHFGHGLHSKDRFSGRYEVIMWYTKSDSYFFDLDAVRIPPKYPGKKYYKGPRKGEYSCNPRGKNPEDVWEIPNVKSNHVEKTSHPCQFPVGLIEMLVLSMTKEGDLVFDPFSGVGSSGVAAALHKRYYWGADTMQSYVEESVRRINDALEGKAKYRSYNVELYDHRKSNLSKPVDRS